MSWHTTPYTLLLILNALGAIFLALLALRRRAVSGAIPLAAIMLTNFVWSAAYALEIGSATLSAKLFWDRAGYTAAVYLPALWLIFVFRHTGWREWLGFRLHIILAVEPTLAALALWTDSIHSLFYTQVSLNTGGPFPALEIAYGPLFVLHLLYASTLIIAGLSMLFGAFLRTPRPYRRYMWAVLLGASIPWPLTLLSILRFIPQAYMSLMPVVFTLMGIVVLRNLHRFQLLSIMPTVREEIVENMSAGVIVLDLQRRITDLNPAAREMTGRTAHEVFGQPADQVLPAWLELVEHCRADAPSQAEIVHGDGTERRYYNLRVSPLFDPRGHPVGWLAILRDVTAARRSEEQYRAFVQNIPVAVYRTTPGPTGRFLMANPAFLHLFGYASEEGLQQITVADVYVTPEERQAFSAELLARGSVAGVELQLKKTDGTLIWGSVSARVVYDERTGEIAYFDCVLEDITERKRAEQALQASERRYQRLAEISPTGIFRTDAKGWTTYVNPRWCEIAGVEASEALGDGWLRAVHPDDSPSVAVGWRETIQSQGTSGAEYRFLRPDGSIAWVIGQAVPETDGEGHVIGYVGTITDITERKRAEEALRASEARLRTLFNAMNDVVIVYDADGRYCEIAPTQPGRLYRPPDELLGRTVGEMLPAPAAERILACIRRVLDSQIAEHLEYDLTIQGQTYWFDTIAQPLEGNRVLWTARDITERKQMEETLRQHSAQLEALREMALNLTAELDLEALLNTIAARAIQLLGGNAGGLYLHRPEQDLLQWSVSVGPRLSPVGAVLHRGEGMAGEIWATGQPLIVDDYSSWAGRAAIYDGYTWNAIVGVPIRWGDQFLGVLEVLADPPRAFSPTDADLLSLFAAQAAIAIRNAHLFQAEREQRALAEALTEAATVVSGTLDLDQVLDRILNEVAQVVNGDAFNVMLIENDHARPVRWRGYERFAAVQTVADTFFRLADMPVLRQMAENGEPTVVTDTATHPGWIVVPRMEWLRSYVAAPIRVRGLTVGFLNVDSSRPNQFGASDARRLEAFASHAAAAIKNARLYQETAHRLAQTQVLRETMLAAARTLDFDQVLEQTLATLQVTMKVEFLSFGFFDAEHGEIRVHPARIGYPVTVEGIPLDRSACGVVFQTGEPLVLGDVRGVPFYLEGNPEVRSELVIPVRAEQRIIGVLNVESRRLNAFDEEDMAFYTAIAGQLGVALENARLYQEVSQALAQRQQLDRMKDEFIQNVSHELRMPLSLIRGHAEMLENGALGELNDDQRQSVSIIARRSRMMGNLVDDITMILETEARRVRPEPVALDELVRVAAEDFQAASAQHELTLRTAIASDLPPVRGLPTHLRRVIDNLIGNAIKFTPPGGTITVRVWREGTHAALQVQDTGIGIPTEQLGRVFERFYQVNGSAKRRYGGVGLGLALVKEITEAYGGRVAVESETGKGSAFTVWLPLAG